MNERFFAQGKEKQDRMMNAAIKCFAIAGYKRTSTDEIVKEAKISKGLLFHYFVSKQGLYEFVYEYCAKYMLMELTRSGIDSELDLAENVKKLFFTYCNVGKQYPYLSLFLEAAFYERDTLFGERTYEEMNKYQDRKLEIIQKMCKNHSEEERLKIRMLEYAFLEISKRELFLEPDLSNAVLKQRVRELLEVL